MYIRQFLVDHGPQLETVPQTCLVILPRTAFADWFFEHILKDVLERSVLGVTCLRSEEVFNPSVTSNRAIENTARAEFVLADVSGRDPEVLYHLGQALVFHDEILIISQNDWDLPFNFAQFPSLKYSPDRESLTQLKRDIANRFATVLGVAPPEVMRVPQPPVSGPREPDSLSTQFLPTAPPPVRQPKPNSQAAIPVPGWEDEDQPTTAPAGGSPPTIGGNPFLDPTSAIPAYVPDTPRGGGHHQPATELLPSANAPLGTPGGLGTINIDAAIKRGTEYKTLGMHKEALAEFRKALDVKPDSPKLYVAVGEIYEELGDADRAIEAFNRAIELDGGNYQAYCGLGIAYARKGMHYEAINAYADAIRLNPNDPSVLSNLGASYNALQMVDDALEAYEQALKLNPNSAKIYLNLGNAYFNKGMYPEAIQSYESALKLEPSYDKARRNLEKAIRRMQGKE